MKCTNLVDREEAGWISAGCMFRNGRLVATTGTRLFGRNAGRMVVVAFLAAASFLVASCGGGGGGGGPAGSVTTADSDAHATLSTAAGFPVVADREGVVVHAVQAVPGALYACYNRTGSPYLMLARSDDNGASWHAGTVDFGGVFASLAVDGNNVYIGYIDQSWKTLKFARSADRGATWTLVEVDDTLKSDPATRTVPDNPAQPYQPDDFAYTSMARSGATFFMAYHDRVHGSLKLARSDDRGSSWVCVTLDDRDDIDGDSPSLAIDGANIFVSYAGVIGSGGTARDSLYLLVSRDAGVTWTKRTVAPAAYATGYRTSLAVQGNRVWVSWFNAFDRKLMVAKSSDYGSTWGTVTIDGSDNAGRYPTLLAGDGVIYISYSDWAHNSQKVAVSRDGGNSWTAGTAVTGTDSCTPAAAAVQGNGLVILYSAGSGAQQGMTGAVLTSLVS